MLFYHNIYDEIQYISRTNILIRLSYKFNHIAIFEIMRVTFIENMIYEYICKNKIHLLIHSFKMRRANTFIKYMNTFVNNVTCEQQMNMRK